MLNLFKKYLHSKGEVSDEQFELIRPLLTFQTVDKGTLLLNQGDVCHQFMFVTKGCLRSYIPGINGKVHILEFAPETRWIGDSVSLFRKIGSIFCIDAIEDSEIILIGMDFYIKMPQLFPDFYLK